MADKIAAFTEDPRTAYGTAAGPWVQSSRQRPSWVSVLSMGLPSKSIRPVHRIERYMPSVRVRVWFANERGSIWMSTGYHTLSLRSYVEARARGWWRRHFGQSVIPTAKVVRR